MALLNGKKGDKIRIINYAHPIWTNKEYYNEMFRAGMTGGKEKPDNIIDEDELTYFHDMNPELVGKEGIITEVSNTQNRRTYATTIGAWFSVNQLELIEMEEKTNEEARYVRPTHEDLERCEKTFITLCKNHFVKYGTNKYKEWEKAYFSGAMMAFNVSIAKWGVALIGGREIITKEQFNNN